MKTREGFFNKNIKLSITYKKKYFLLNKFSFTSFLTTVVYIFGEVIGMVNINSNYALVLQQMKKQKMSALDSAMERLSTGKRINYARDDAAGQAIATRLTAEIQGLAAVTKCG